MAHKIHNSVTFYPEKHGSVGAWPTAARRSPCVPDREHAKDCTVDPDLRREVRIAIRASPATRR
jgi:hypothetical protein